MTFDLALREPVRAVRRCPKRLGCEGGREGGRKIDGDPWVCDVIEGVGNPTVATASATRVLPARLSRSLSGINRCLLLLHVGPAVGKDSYGPGELPASTQGSDAARRRSRGRFLVAVDGLAISHVTFITVVTSTRAGQRQTTVSGVR